MRSGPNHYGPTTLQETFWALRFGMLVDRFGIPWMINCEKAVVSVDFQQRTGE